MINSIRFSFLLGGLLALLSVASAQSWVQQSPPANPGLRGAYAMVYDTARNRTVLFGGVDPKPPQKVYNQTWIHDGITWTNVTPTSPASSPSGRFLAAMAYDSHRQRAVLFGGHSGSAILQDTWEWDGQSWLKIAVSGTVPTLRHGHGMAYDPIQRKIVMFGGQVNGPGLLNDTWLYDGVKGTWTQVHPPKSPSLRSNIRLVYDPSRGKTLLFGGSDGTTRNDLWEWDGATLTWTQIVSSSPSAPWPASRYSYACDFDPVTRSVFVFGGVYGTYNYLNDTWQLTGTNTWKQVSTPTAPSARGYASMVYDTSRARFLLYGGAHAHTSAFNDTWEFGHSGNASLAGQGPTSPGTVHNLIIQAPQSGGLSYVMASSLGNGPIPIGSRSLGLSLDWILMITVGGAFPGTFQNYQGTLTAQGLASPQAQFAIPASAFWKGLTIYTAYVTLLSSSPFGIHEISNTYPVQIQ